MTANRLNYAQLSLPKHILEEIEKKTAIYLMVTLCN